MICMGSKLKLSELYQKMRILVEVVVAWAVEYIRGMGVQVATQVMPTMVEWILIGICRLQMQEAVLDLMAPLVLVHRAMVMVLLIVVWVTVVMEAMLAVAQDMVGLLLPLMGIQIWQVLAMLVVRRVGLEVLGDLSRHLGMEQ